MNLKHVAQATLAAIGLVLSRSATQGATVSGTVSYGGSQPGPIWVSASPTNDTNWVLNVDGSGDYLTDSTNAALNLTTNVMLEAWIKVNSFNNWGWSCHQRDFEDRLQHEPVERWLAPVLRELGQPAGRRRLRRSQLSHEDDHRPVVSHGRRL
jgi:hypothetical protein